MDTIFELGNQEKVSMKSDDDKSFLVCRTFERKNRQFPLEKEGEKNEKCIEVWTSSRITEKLADDINKVKFHMI